MTNFFQNTARMLIRRQTEKREARKVGGRCCLALQGRQAFLDGLTPVDCPFVLCTLEWTSWVTGWRMGYDRRFQ